MNYKKVLATLEHIALIAIIAAAIGFVAGNHYGSEHVSLSAVAHAQASK